MKDYYARLLFFKFLILDILVGINLFSIKYRKTHEI